MGAVAKSLDVATFDVDVYSQTAKSTIRQAIEDFNPDIVHAHGSRPALFARQADKFGVRRCVVTLHGLQGAHGIGSFAKLALERNVLENTAHFITVCKANRDQAAKLGVLDLAKTTVIYNGISLPLESDLQQFRQSRYLSQQIGVDEDWPALLHIGRICGEKDQPTLLHAFAWLRAREPHAQLAMIATGDEYAKRKLQRLARKLGIEHAVHYLTTYKDPTALYASCDAFVLPSLWEGLPYTVIEAMAAGAVVVASDVDGIPEAIVNEVTGYLVPPKDPELLAERLEDVIDLSQTQRKHLQENARTGIEQRFMLDDMINKTIEVYKKVIGEQA
jgi:glycosyltransferase involved in cell wall biosynthesis